MLSTEWVLGPPVVRVAPLEGTAGQATSKTRGEHPQFCMAHRHLRPLSLRPSHMKTAPLGSSAARAAPGAGPTGTPPSLPPASACAGGTCVEVGRNSDVDKHLLWLFISAFGNR